MKMLPKNRIRLQSIKMETAQSREMIELMQKVVDHERQKDSTPEIAAKLNELETQLAEHRTLLDKNEVLIAKLEQPFLKFWKWMF